MPRPKCSVPTPHHHRPSNQVRVRLDGRDLYCGTWDDQKSHEKAKRLIADWLTGGSITAAAAATNASGGLSVAELILAYVEFNETYYVRAVKQADGSTATIPTREQDDLRDVLRIVRGQHGTIPVADYGPLKLKAVRELMVSRGWCRSYVNKQVGRVKRMFKWGVENELVPPGIYHGLQAVADLRIDRSAAPEAQPVKPVETATVNATLPYLSPVVAAMVKFQAASGCRPGEVCQLRPCDVDRSGLPLVD